MSVHAAAVTASTVVVAVDVGKSSAALSVTDAGRHRLLGPVELSMTRSALVDLVEKVRGVLPGIGGPVKVGVEAAGHYHRPLIELSAWPAGWEVLELNPAHVTEQRRVQGRRRVKTDAIDLEAITELLLAGRGVPVTGHDLVIGELVAWSAHRARRIQTRTATKNQLLGQLDRSFPGLTLALPDVLGCKIGRLVAAEFADPARLASLGVTRLIRFAAARDLQVRRPLAERLVKAAGDALPTTDAAVARRVLAADLVLLGDLDSQIVAVEAELARLLPVSPFHPLTSVPGWGVVRASSYGAAVGAPTRWPGSAPALPGRRVVTDAVRVGRPPPRRLDQPRGQRRTTPRADRPRHRAMAQRTGRQGLRRRPEGSRETRRDHRLRPGAPREPDRVRSGPRPGRLRPRTLDLTTAGFFLDSCHLPVSRSCQRGAPAAQPGRTTLTATSTGTHSDSEEESLTHNRK